MLLSCFLELIFRSLLCQWKMLGISELEPGEAEDEKDGLVVANGTYTAGSV